MQDTVSDLKIETSWEHCAIYLDPVEPESIDCCRRCEQRTASVVSAWVQIPMVSWTMMNPFGTETRMPLNCPAAG